MPSSWAVLRVQPVPVIVFVFGAVTAIGGYFAINEYASVRLQRELDEASAKVSSTLTASIDRHIDVGRSTAAMFSEPNASVSRWTFFEFAKTLPEKNPGLSAVEWIPRVPSRQRAKFEKAANADGLFDFHFVQRTTDGRRVRAGRRSVYYPVYFVEPYNGNEARLGLDLAATKKGRAYLAQIRDSGSIAATHTDLSAPGGSRIAGFSVIFPVYQSRVPPFSVKERRRSLSGYVRTRFRFDRWLQSLRSGIGELPALEILIFERDNKNQRSLVNFIALQTGESGTRPAKTSDVFRGAHTVVEHDVAGQKWSIVVRPVPGAVQNALGLTAWGFVAFTVLLTALLLRHLITMRLARDQAEAANRAKSEFLAMMSHELRTPLNAMIGFSEMMINELFGPLSNAHYKEYTANINRSATHLLGLINSILDLSKAEAGNYDLDRKVIALSDIWEAVLPPLQAGISDTGLTLNDNIAGSPIKLHVDPDVFRQILHNLLSNAITYTPKGGSVTAEVTVEDDDCFTLCIADTGIGIAEKDIELVLTPFRQVDNSLARKYEGVGLGLPLTRMLVDIHGGSLQLESKLNEGTQVTVRFPADIVVKDGAPGDETEREEEHETAFDQGDEEPANRQVAGRN